MKPLSRIVKKRMAKYFHPDSDFFRKTLKVEPPSATAHATKEEIMANMKQLKPRSWTLKGNQLEGMTEQGRLVQTIPTSHILVGTDNDGMPIFRRISL